jgi:HlyD family secretion protein
MEKPNPDAHAPEPDSEIARTLGLHGANRKPKSRLRWLLVALLVFAAVSVVYALKTGARPDGPRYRTESADRGDLTVVVGATGNLQPINQVDVGSELSGIVESVSVDFNDRIQAGQELARLDAAKLRAQVAQSEASLAAARAKVDQVAATIREAENHRSRLEQLRKTTRGQGVSRHDLDAAEATLARARADASSARAAVAQAEAILDVNRSDLEKTAIRSPIDGIVLHRNVEPGQTVAASLQAPVLFTLAEDLSRMELLVAVDEADVGQVVEGQTATFAVDAFPNRAFRAAITRVRYGPKNTDGVVTYETLLAVDNSDLSLRPGMTATAEITVASATDIPRVPNAALRFSPADPERSSGGQSILSALTPGPPRRRTPGRANRGGDRPDGDPAVRQVWTVAPDGTLAPLRVRIGRTDGTWTEILDGDIQPGDALVVDVLASGGRK